jgi:hypothetical protein
MSIAAEHLRNYAVHPHIIFMCSIWFSQLTAITSQNCINQLVFIMKTRHVSCEVRTEFLNINLKKSMLQRVTLSIKWTVLSNFKPLTGCFLPYIPIYRPILEVSFLSNIQISTKPNMLKNWALKVCYTVSILHIVVESYWFHTFLLFIWCHMK